MAGTIAQAPQNGNDTVNLRHAGVQFGISDRKHSDRRQDVSPGRLETSHPFRHHGRFVTTGTACLIAFRSEKTKPPPKELGRGLDC